MVFQTINKKLLELGLSPGFIKKNGYIIALSVKCGNTLSDEFKTDTTRGLRECK